MDKVTRYEWHGNAIILIVLVALVITTPFAVVYFITNLIQIETEVKDGEALNDFLNKRA